jgi:hypothetical protein
MSQTDFQEIFNQLQPYLKKYEQELVVTTDQNQLYYLDSNKIFPRNNKPYFFGSVSVKKNYVSYYLMPVYMFPDLLESISPSLKARMQGKSCFNFKKVNPELFRELEQLTDASFNRFQKEDLI